MQLEHRAVPEDAFGSVAAQHEPRLARPARAGRRDRPPAGHPQVRAQDDATLETEDQVLAVGRDGLEHTAVEPLGDPFRLSARMRRLGGDALSDQNLQPARGAMDRVPLGHAATVTGVAQCGREPHTLDRSRSGRHPRLGSRRARRPEDPRERLQRCGAAREVRDAHARLAARRRRAARLERRRLRARFRPDQAPHDDPAAAPRARSRLSPSTWRCSRSARSSTATTRPAANPASSGSTAAAPLPRRRSGTRSSVWCSADSRRDRARRSGRARSARRRPCDARARGSGLERRRPRRSSPPVT